MSIDDIDRNRGASRRDFIKTATAAAGIYWLGPTLMFQGEGHRRHSGRVAGSDECGQIRPATGDLASDAADRREPSRSRWQERLLL
ncbi:MAG: twin-arginine translocation signal domain-containing protein [Rhodoplanes sp.]